MDKISKAFLRITLLSLSNDLKRIVQSIERGSIVNAKVFTKEARRWLKELISADDEYLINLLKKIDLTLKQKNDLKKAEDCLMYSVLLQNKALNQEK